MSESPNNLDKDNENNEYLHIRMRSEIVYYCINILKEKGLICEEVIKTVSESAALLGKELAEIVSDYLSDLEVREEDELLRVEEIFDENTIPNESYFDFTSSANNLY